MQMPPPAKLDELRARLKADPKNRVFFPLAEELRKVGQVQEAEQVLRLGLTHHPTYLSAWVSLGRVLRDLNKHAEAVDALTKALQLDPGNVVAARLLGDAYMGLGEKIEAIKKYKLVVALMPGDEEFKGMVERLDREINAPAIAVSAASDDDAFEGNEASPAALQQTAAEPLPQAAPVVQAPAEAFSAPPVEPPPAETPFEAPAPESEAFEPAAASPFEQPAEAAMEPPSREAVVFGEESGPFNLRPQTLTEDSEPMRAQHEESPFEEPLEGSYSADAMALESPAGIHVEEAHPAEAEPWGEEEQAPQTWDEEPVAEEASESAPPEPEDLINTLTMADLYARQGLTDQARRIYENILQKDPGNDDVRQKFDRLSSQEVPAAQGGEREVKIARLQSWLSRIERGEVGRV
jgi:tetratricopeptide (TPR) repeat protein